MILSSVNTSRAKRFDRAVDGILLLDKPQGVSSNAALQRARALFRAIKAGHAGSLDPLATGMLPVCFGQATKSCGWLLDSRKTYRVVATLGVQTDSGDAEGKPVAEAAVPMLGSELLDAALKGFLGEQLQVPPMFSALKHQGRPLYEMARRGESIERAPRKIVIERIDLLAHAGASFEFEVRCSKGTYVRSLVEDIARTLGTLGHVSALRRTELEPFGTGPMLGFEALEAMDLEQRAAHLLPADAALAALPQVQLDAAASRALSQGQPVALAGMERSATPIRAYHFEGRFLGLVDVQQDGVLKPRRLFV